MAPSMGFLAASTILFLASNLQAQINFGDKKNLLEPLNNVSNDKNSSEQNYTVLGTSNNSENNKHFESKKALVHVKKDLNENHKRGLKKATNTVAEGLQEFQERSSTKKPVESAQDQNIDQKHRRGLQKIIKRSLANYDFGFHIIKEKNLNTNHTLGPKRILKRSPVDTFQETKLFLQEGSSSTKHSVELSEEKNEDKDDGGDTSYRLTRSASQEQWVKQPYPVHKGNEEEDTEGSDNMRAPKVHFVTQKRTDNANNFGNVGRELERERNYPRARSRSFLSDRTLPEYRYREAIPEHENHGSYARERSFDKRGFFDRIKEPYRPMREKFHDFAPYEHDYPPRRSFNFYPPENGFSNSYTSFPSRKRYGRRYETYRQYDFEGNNMEKPKKQTRIIYYATLPEVARSPPKVNLRDRFNYNYDGYLDDPYFGSGRFREPYIPPPQFFENDPKRIKPSTSATTFSKDVAVKEPKKIPESRIYSEAERRYGDDYDRFPIKNT